MVLPDRSLTKSEPTTVDELELETRLAWYRLRRRVGNCNVWHDRLDGWDAGGVSAVGYNENRCPGCPHFWEHVLTSIKQGDTVLVVVAMVTYRWCSWVAAHV
jgi:hypothetical protein